MLGEEFIKFLMIESQGPPAAPPADNNFPVSTQTAAVPRTTISAPFPIFASAPLPMLPTPIRGLLDSSPQASATHLAAADRTPLAAAIVIAAVGPAPAPEKLTEMTALTSVDPKYMVPGNMDTPGAAT